MTESSSDAFDLDALATGVVLPVVEIPVTRTLVVAGAITSRDFEAVHHDHLAAIERGSADVFMNILTTNGLVGKFVTDWAGPTARLCGIDIRLGAPNYPGDTMRMEGHVIAVERGEATTRATVSVRGSNSMGDHATGTVDVEWKVT